MKMFEKHVKTKIAKVRYTKAKMAYKRETKKEVDTFLGQVLKRIKQAVTIFLVIFILQGLIKGLNTTKTIVIENAKAADVEASIPEPCELKDVECGQTSAPIAQKPSGSIEQIITEVFGDDAPTAIAVFKAESGLRADAVGDRHIEYIENGKVKGHSCGIAQIRVIGNRPDCEQLKDAEFNIRYAKNLFDKSGFQPWSAFKNNSYRKFL